VEHPNIELVRRAYAAYLSGDRPAIDTLFAPDLAWHNSGFDSTSGDRHGIEDVLAYLWADNHMDDYRLEVIDMLASDERVAVVARTSGHLGARAIVNDFVQVVRIDDGRIAEVWNYYWDQRALAEALPAAS
jgi:ketosteroid isomerase-like protein